MNAILKVEGKAPKVGVIILHYNRPELAADCLASLRRQTFPLAQVLLVDNGSEKCMEGGSAEWHPATRILKMRENLGFAGGVNAGLRWFREHAEVDYVWLLNNDVVCSPEVLNNLVNMLEGHPSMGAVSATMEEHQPDGGRLLVTGGKFPLPLLIPFVSKPGESVDYLCGACLLLRREAIEQVGFLDDNFFFFFEDVDWCLRARRCGWDLGVCEAGGVFHQRSSTIGRLHRLRANYYRRSYIRFLRRYSRAPLWVAGITTFYRLFSDAMHGRWQACAGTFEGFFQGWRDEPADAA